MSLQSYFDAIFAMQRARETTMRIGEALEQLKDLPQDANIKISMEWVEPYKEYYDTFNDKEYAEKRKHEYDNVQMYFDGTFGSDRGDYANMYLGYKEEPTTFTVQNLIDLLKTAKAEKTMEGYKGGTFLINDETLLTIAYYSFSEGIRPTSFELVGDEVIMHTTYKE